MFTILVVAPPASEVDGLASRHPSIEILRAHDTEEAVERLGRNRRIDALLLLAGDPVAAAETIREVLEENPAPPPIFVAVAAGAMPPEGARGLPVGPPDEVVRGVVKALEAPSRD